MRMSFRFSTLRIAFDMKLPGLLYHVSILRSFQKIHKDYQLNPSNTKIREMNRFAKHILQKFFEVSKTNKHIWMELCFWKTSREASEVVEGYGTQAATKVSTSIYLKFQLKILFFSYFPQCLTKN